MITTYYKKSLSASVCLFLVFLLLKHATDFDVVFTILQEIFPKIIVPKYLYDKENSMYCDEAVKKKRISEYLHCKHRLNRMRYIKITYYGIIITKSM